MAPNSSTHKQREQPSPQWRAAYWKAGWSRIGGSARCPDGEKNWSRKCSVCKRLMLVRWCLIPSTRSHRMRSDRADFEAITATNRKLQIGSNIKVESTWVAKAKQTKIWTLESRTTPQCLTRTSMRAETQQELCHRHRLKTKNRLIKRAIIQLKWRTSLMTCMELTI